MTRETLITEALERGYKIGVQVNSLGGTKNYTIIEDPTLWYLPSGFSDQLRTSSDCMIYSDGKWATILNTSSEIITNYQIY